MISTVLTKVFGSKHERDVKRLQPQVAAINALEPELQQLSDSQLQARTAELRTRLDQGASLDDVLVPAFATVREAGRRTCATTTCSWSAAWSCTRGRSRR
jgi:preprotein translocase subunit SecA